MYVGYILNVSQPVPNKFENLNLTVFETAKTVSAWNILTLWDLEMGKREILRSIINSVSSVNQIDYYVL